MAAGALTTLPVVCMGLLAPVAAVLARRFGDAGAVLIAVLCVTMGAALRSVLGLVGLYGGTAVAGVGIAIAGTLLPGIVRSRSPDRVGPITGVYTATIIFGAFAASGLTEPLRAVLHLNAQQVLSWWAIPAVIAAAIWTQTQVLRARSPITSATTAVPEFPTSRAPMVATVTDPAPVTSGAASELGGSRTAVAEFEPSYRASPWRDRRAWLATLFMGGQSLMFYATLAWLAPTYTERGMSAPHAGLLLALFSATQVVTALAMPWLAHRSGNMRPWIAISVGLTILALAFVAAVPNVVAAAPWIWAAMLGLGMGGNLSLALTEVTRSAPTPTAAAAYSGMAFFVGYVLAAVGPVAAGAVRDATGGFTVVFASLAMIGIATLVAALAAA